MQKKRAGQALVEFVILLPIFVFMLLSVIDIGKILYFKNHLESKMDSIITDYELLKDETLLQEKIQKEKEEITLDIQPENDYLVFQLNRSIDIVTPGLNLVFGNPYIVSVKRVIYHES